MHSLKEGSSIKLGIANAGVSVSIENSDVSSSAMSQL